MLDIAIIIVNYKMADHIEKCLASLAYELNATPLSFRMVIVDNASNDHVDEVISRSILSPHITLIHKEKNTGMASGVNVGLSSIEARYYFILNPDTVFFESASIYRLVKWMDAHTLVGMMGPKLLNDDGTLQFSCWRFPSFLTPLFRRTRFGATRRGKKILSSFHMKEWDHNRTQPVDCIMGSAMVVRNTALQQVGVMSDDYFMYFEDIDWCRRFWQKHIPVYYFHEVRIYHKHQRDSAKVEGIKALLFNRMTRVHVASWLKYLWKWRGQTF